MFHSEPASLGQPALDGIVTIGPGFGGRRALPCSRFASHDRLRRRNIMTIVWFIVWMVHGHPWLLGEWNPWNIALLACAFFDNLGTVRFRSAGPRRAA